MAQDADTLQPGQVGVGADGFAMLALSGALILLTLGASLAVGFGYVLLTALRTPSLGSAGKRVVVLAMRLSRVGELTSDYRARLDRSWALWRYAPGSEIVILGGITSLGAPSEAAVGACYLRARGRPAEEIRTENRSRHTLENLILYRAEFTDFPADPPLLITSRFHLARSSLLARGLGIPHICCAAEDRRLPRTRDLPRMLNEALFVHWYLIGLSFARLTDNRRLVARITWYRWQAPAEWPAGPNVGRSRGCKR
jgi:uncharacterized SAM-binding protein YcdF (DUF218 family)